MHSPFVSPRPNDYPSHSHFTSLHCSTAAHRIPLHHYYEGTVSFLKVLLIRLAARTALVPPCQLPVDGGRGVVSMNMPASLAASTNATPARAAEQSPARHVSNISLQFSSFGPAWSSNGLAISQDEDDFEWLVISHGHKRFRKAWVLALVLFSIHNRKHAICWGVGITRLDLHVFV